MHRKQSLNFKIKQFKVCKKKKKKEKSIKKLLFQLMGQLTIS